MTEATRMAETSKIQDAVSKVNALRKLTRESGCITTRTQSKILQALTADEMTAVAEILAAQPEASRG
jgi:cytochrome c553